MADFLCEGISRTFLKYFSPISFQLFRIFYPTNRKNTYLTLHLKITKLQISDPVHLRRLFQILMDLRSKIQTGTKAFQIHNTDSKFKRTKLTVIILTAVPSRVLSSIYDLDALTPCLALVS